jgi:transposase
LTGPLLTLAELQARLATRLPPAPPQTVSSVAPYRATVQEFLEQGLETEAIYQRLKEQHGFTGHYQAVWRFVRKLQPQRPDVTVRVELAPGVEVQVDFGYAGRMFDPVRQRVRKSWAFVGTLSFSRHQYVEFVFDQTVPTWLACHAHMLSSFGGVPRQVRIDNLKAAIVRACLEEPQAQRAYRECAEHYGFLITPCRPGTPRHKGKVENGVHYVKRNLLAGRDYTQPQHNIQQANQDALRWVNETAGRRRHGTTKQIPLEQFEQVERAVLRPLPPIPFELVTWQQVKLHRDCHIVFDNAYYSAPYRYVGESLWVRATAQSVEIYREFERLVIHTRARQPGQRQTLLVHLPPVMVYGLTLTPSACLTARTPLVPRLRSGPATPG